jgi:hypothetical protein
MSISMAEMLTPLAQALRINKDTLTVDLSDGRTISVPVAWFPRLSHATDRERGRWRIIGRGEGIHWDDLDEDVSVAGLLAGRPSGESQESFGKWLRRRARKPREGRRLANRS